MKFIIHLPRHIFHSAIGRYIEPNRGELKPVPNYILWLMLFLCSSVLLQGVADVALKLLSYTSVLPSMPWRTDFLFLTAVSVLMGYRTLTGMHQRTFDVTRNSIEVGLIVELGLIVGDAEFIRAFGPEIPHVFLMRVPFMVLTLINLAILVYTYHTLDMKRWGKG